MKYINDCRSRQHYNVCWLKRPAQQDALVYALRDLQPGEVKRAIACPPKFCHDCVCVASRSSLLTTESSTGLGVASVSSQ
eukprot:9477939-Ditylum_brightwellii.AAC.1